MGKVRGEPRNRRRDPENAFRIHTEISGIMFEYEPGGNFDNFAYHEGASPKTLFERWK